MNHAIAYGGSQGSRLWTNAITASPYIWQYLDYDSPEVLDTYNSFAALAGCGERGGETFECLQSAASSNLTAANEQIASASLLGAFVWRPVIDGEFIQQRPTDALQGRINGQRVLTGNNANDGLIFVPQNITTQGRFVDYLRLYFPRLDDDAIASILDVYHTPDVPDSPNSPKFQTAGDSGPTAVNQSELTTGHQQVANNFNAEVSFICPSYWLASSFEKNGGAAYQYQFSVTPALHAFDVLHYFPSSFFPADPDVAATFQRAYGGFVTINHPSSWPQKTVESPLMENLNATGGQPVDFNGFTIFVDPGVEPDFRSVDADTWEGGRAERCDFLRSLSDVLLI
ncbi:carboxylesterase type b [Neofusicoccum parvum]|nr:carboxylesterase type b [Neofusicoccum parvum]